MLHHHARHRMLTTVGLVIFLAGCRSGSGSSGYWSACGAGDLDEQTITQMLTGGALRAPASG